MKKLQTIQTARIVIAGASGFIGQQLIPRLRRQGYELLLLGRDIQKLKSTFPDLPCATYANWHQQAHNYDAIINLAVVNNDQCVDKTAIQSANVALPLTLAQTACEVNIPRFIQISSVHALDTGNTTTYAHSKREATHQLKSLEGIDVSTLYLPLVWGDNWSGKLSWLNKIPRPIAKSIFHPLAALKPTVHVDRIAGELETLFAAPNSTPITSRVVSDDVGRNGFYRFGTAAMDYGFATVTLGLFWWALLLIALWVRVTSPGPGIFAQQRVGKGGKNFTCYKFRTMREGTKQAGTHEISAASVTPVGAFLRRTKLDELPQAWNILKGDLRLVGPRPGLPVQAELFSAREAAGVFSIKPGITGWAQIHDVDMSDPQKLAQWDADYMGMRGLIMDVRIIFATAFGHGQGDRTSPQAE